MAGLLRKGVVEALVFMGCQVVLQVSRQEAGKVWGGITPGDRVASGWTLPRAEILAG